MKQFTKQEIDSWRKIFIDRGYLRREAQINGRVIEYFVMPPNLFGNIRNGLFRMTGNLEDGYLIGVSDEVPLEVQPFFAISEHDEFMVYGLNDLERTLHSEENMVSFLNSLKDSYLTKQYLLSKIELYNSLIMEAKNNFDKFHFTESDYLGFIKAIDYLRKKLRELDR